MDFGKTNIRKRPIICESVKMCHQPGVTASNRVTTSDIVTTNQLHHKNRQSKQQLLCSRQLGFSHLSWRSPGPIGVLLATLFLMSLLSTQTVSGFSFLHGSQAVGHRETFYYQQSSPDASVDDDDQLFTGSLAPHSHSTVINGAVIPTFYGNTTHRDYFKLLREDGNSVLVGARNVVYNLSLPFLEEHVNERIYWSSLDVDRELCLIKGKKEDDCQNYIRVLARVDSKRILVCGTNSYKPRCRYYVLNGDDYEIEKQFNGQGYSPFDPRHNSTSIFTGGDLYSGTVGDFSGTDSLIMKNQIRTEQYDFKQLNDPDFVSSVEDRDHVYFFFREAAVEYINCGKNVYSRVGRVCKNDRGGPGRFRSRWSSFLKARLNCSVPGEYPFYYSEIQSTTANFYPAGPGGQNHDGNDDDQVFYAVFTTPPNAIPGSAVCRFTVGDLNRVFEEGLFKGRDSVNANWLAVSPSRVPNPRPGVCRRDDIGSVTGGGTRNGTVLDNNSAGNSDEASFHFVRDHSLMDSAVPSSPSTPVYHRSGSEERFTRIAVDKNVEAVDRQLYDVLYIGTNRGVVLKVSVDSTDPAHATSHLLETIHVFPPGIPVRNLLIVRNNVHNNPNNAQSDPSNVYNDPDSVNNVHNDPHSTQADNHRLVVLSDDEVRSIPLENCVLTSEDSLDDLSLPWTSCRVCVSLRSPYCGWDPNTESCVSVSQVPVGARRNILQNLTGGVHHRCPEIPVTLPPPVNDLFWWIRTLVVSE